MTIPLPHFARRKRRAPLRPPPNDLVSLIEEPAIEEVFQRKPNAFDERTVIGDVRVAQIDPEADPLGQFFPLRRITEDVGDATMDEGFETKTLDFFLRVFLNQPFFHELLAHFNLDGKTMGVPTCFSLAEISLHRLVTGIQIFHCARETVAGMRDSVGGGRPFIKNKRALVRFSTSL